MNILSLLLISLTKSYLIYVYVIKDLNKNIKSMHDWKKKKITTIEFSIALLHIHVFLIGENYGVEIIELRRHGSARKAGRSVRQKLICRVRERCDVARRLLISSLIFARERNWLPSRAVIPESARAEGPIDLIEKTGWYTRERYYSREDTTGRHDPGHHSIESYIRPAFTWQYRASWWSNKLVRVKLNKN